MPVALVRTAGAYRDVLADQRHPDPMNLPVLDEQGSHDWPRRIAARLGVDLTVADDRRPDGGCAVGVSSLSVSGPAKPRRNHVVVALSDGEFVLPAAAFARVKEAVLELAPSTAALCAVVASYAGSLQYLTIVGCSNAFTFRDVAVVLGQFPWLRVGILAANTVGKLSELVWKTLAYAVLPARRDALIAPLMKGSEPIEDGSLTSYPHDAIDTASLTSNQDMHRVLSLITHGSEDYLRMGQRELLCGLTSDRQELAAAATEEGPLPACLQGSDCVYPGATRFDPAYVPAQVVFANACLTMKVGKQLLGRNNRFTISTRFLDGWTGTYVASPLLKDGITGENLLFHNLLSEGLTVGECTRLVNDNLRRWGIDAPTVLVMGDPEATYQQADKSTECLPVPDVECTAQQGRAVIQLRGKIPSYARVEVSDADLSAAHHGEGLQIRSEDNVGGKLPFYTALGEIESQLNVFIFGICERPIVGAEDRTLVVEPRDPHPDYRQLTRAWERYDNLGFLDIKIERARSILGELANQLPTLARRVKASQADVAVSADVRRSLQRISSGMAQLDEQLLATLLRLTETREYHFVEAYRPFYTVEDVLPRGEPCVYCGEAAYRYVSANVLRPHLRRYLDSCVVCGATWDSEEPEVDIYISGRGRLIPGTRKAFHAILANGTDETLDLRFGSRITHGRSQGFEVEVDPASLSLAPQSKAEVKIVVSTGYPSERHTVLLRFYAVGLGRIIFAGRDLWVR